MVKEQRFCFILLMFLWPSLHYVTKCVKQLCNMNFNTWHYITPRRKIIWAKNTGSLSFIFSSPELKAHGWANSIPVTLASVVRPLAFSNIFSSETTGPIELKFHMDGGTKVCSNGPGHMTKMAATPIYGKNPLKIFSRTRRPMTFGLGM